MLVENKEKRKGTAWSKETKWLEDTWISEKRKWERESNDILKSPFHENNCFICLELQKKQLFSQRNVKLFEDSQKKIQGEVNSTGESTIVVMFHPTK